MTTALWIRHAEPALLVDAVDRGEAFSCTGLRDSWNWAQILDGAAQAAGLYLGQRPALRIGYLVAAYDDVQIECTEHRGFVRWSVQHRRSLSTMHELAVAACDDAGALLLHVHVVLAARRS